MLGSLSLSALTFVFAAAAGAVWAAGVRLSDTTDILGERFGLGQALAGLAAPCYRLRLPESPSRQALPSAAAISVSLWATSLAALPSRRRCSFSMMPSALGEVVP